MLLVEPAGSTTNADVADRFRAALSEALTSAAGAPVAVGLAPSGEHGLFDDLRGLPTQLATRETLGLSLPRWVLAARFDVWTEASLAGEMVLVDRSAPALLGFRAFRVGGLPALTEAASSFCRECLPRSAAAAAAVDASATAAATTLGAATTTTRPQPAPDPGRDSIGEHLIAASSSAVGSLPRTRPTTPPLPAATAALVKAYLGTSLAAGTVGQASSRPRVYEASWQTLLLPANGANGKMDPHAPVTRAVMTAYTTETTVEVDLRFSRPLKPQLRQDGTWYVCDVSGVQVETEQTADLGADGFLTVRARPGDEPGSVRFGCSLRTPGDKGKMELRDGGRLVAIVLPKPEPGFDPDGPGGVEPFSLDAGHVVGSYTGVASWYGSEGHGGPTASGERFNMYAMTAAHRTLRLGTWVLVTNLNNGKQVVVRINDRGPYVGGRIIDMSYAAASALGFTGSGVTSVRVDVLDGKR